VTWNNEVAENPTFKARAEYWLTQARLSGRIFRVGTN